jgi:hypothetical protein
MPLARASAASASTEHQAAKDTDSVAQMDREDQRSGEGRVSESSQRPRDS